MTPNRVSVGFYSSDDTNREMVGLTINQTSVGMTSDLARNIAVDLMLWAERIDEINSNCDEDLP